MFVRLGDVTRRDEMLSVAASSVRLGAVVKVRICCNVVLLLQAQSALKLEGMVLEAILEAILV